MSVYKKLNQITLYVDRKIPFTIDLNIGDKTDTAVDFTEYESIVGKVRELETSPVVEEFDVIENPEFLRNGRILAVLNCENLTLQTYYFDFVGFKDGRPVKLVSGVISVRPTYSI